MPSSSSTIRIFFMRPSPGARGPTPRTGCRSRAGPDRACGDGASRRGSSGAGVAVPDGQEECEGAAFAGRADHLDPTMMRANEHLDKREPEAGALHRVDEAALDAGELLEDPRLLLRRNADPVIGH